MKYLYTVLVAIFYTFNACAQVDLDLDIVGNASDDKLEFNEESNDIKDSSSSGSIIENALSLFKKSPSTEKTFSGTIDELVKKAESGDVEAQLDLGYMYLYGVNGVNADYKQSLHYYELAANKGNAIALNNLGSLHFNGIGTEVNYAKAIEFFKTASNLGSDDASVNLAIIYLGDSNSNRTPDTYEKVFTLLEKAKNNSIAKYLLGYSYYVGFWVDKDLKKAFNLIKEVADKDLYDEAQYVLADFYINGLATPKNYNKAVAYLFNASNQGYPDAIYKLGDVFAEGVMYTRDIKKAHIQYNIAAVMGISDAVQKRDDLEKSIKIEELLTIQAEAENYQAAPSEKTSFIRKTYGDSLKVYIDKNIGYISLQ
jgi:TPR repeat protein